MSAQPPAAHDPAAHDPFPHDPAPHDPAPHDPALEHALRHALAVSEARFRLFMQHARTPLAITGVDGRFLAVNRAACRLFGREEDDLLSRTWQELTHPDDLAADLANTERLRQGRGDHFAMLKRFLRPDGTIASCELSVIVERSADGAVDHFISQMTDLTPERTMREALTVERELRRAEVRYRAVVENLAEGVVIHEGGRVIDANAAAQRILGLHLEEMDRMHHHSPGTRRVRQFHADGTDFPAREHPSEVARRTGQPVRDVVMGVERPDHTRSWILVNAQPVPDPVGRGIDTVVTSFADITALKAAEQQLIHQAMHDPLTGMPNRALLHEHVAAALRRHHRTGVPLSLVFVDLDGFKAVNDESGHMVGDEILRQIAHRLVRTVRVSDIAGRIGGDEFLIICEGSGGDESMVEGLAERILAVIPEPVEVDHVTYRVGASIGIARANSGASPEELVQLADAAMYAAKRLGGGRYVTLGGVSRGPRPPSGRAGRMRPRGRRSTTAPHRGPRRR